MDAELPLLSQKMQRRDLNPSLWGRPAWAFLDYVAAGYPDVALWNEQMQMTLFLEGLGSALPCGRCRENFKRFAAAKPPGLAVGGKEALRRWLDDLRQSIK